MAKYHYMAKAAHLAVMAELAARDYNVAMPEIDIGDDIFAVNDTSGNFWRVQVKYGKLKVQKKSIAAIFSCREDQLQKPDTPELYYVFVFRTDDGWRYVVFSRDSLNTHYKSNGFGTRFIQVRQHGTDLEGTGRMCLARLANGPTSPTTEPEQRLARYGVAAPPEKGRTA